MIANDEAILGVDPATGRLLWRVPSTEDDRVEVAGELIVQRHRAATSLDPVRFTVIDPADGHALWRGGPVVDPRVTRDAVVTTACDDRGRHCQVTRRDLRTGKVRWRLPGDRVWVADTAVGVRAPLVPSTGQVLALRPGSDRPLPWTGREGLGLGGWYSIVVGRTLIATDNDPPSGDRNCTVRVAAGAAGTSTVTWTAKVYSGRRADGDCLRRLVPDSTGLDLIGTGSRVATSTVDLRPQVFDLVKGRAVWKGDAAGVPIDGDGHSLLVRAQAHAGPLALLDFATGRVRWKAPDPGLEGESASWETAVTRDRVAVTGADRGRPFVLVYDTASGRQLGRFPGWLQGLGDDWVAVGHSGPRGDTLTHEFIRI